jgi:ParB family transcriptional regulator, chromosome partitioning protein
MMDQKHTPTVELILVDRITVINPRARNKRSFKDMAESIADVGLKQPVTVARRESADGPRYDLVCGQGRLEAYLALGQKEIPAIVIEADLHECLLKSLVENCARRKHSALDIFHDIEGMKRRGHSLTEIAKKTGLHYQHVRDITRLLGRGEQRLLKAVAAGQIPVSVAVEIAEADDGKIQSALQEAYDKGELRGQSLLAARRLATQRRQRGKGAQPKSAARGQRVTPNALIRAYRLETDRKRLLIRKADVTRDRLIFVTEALRTLLSDDNFRNLLRAEGLETLPRKLAERIQNKGAAA